MSNKASASAPTQDEYRQQFIRAYSAMGLEALHRKGLLKAQTAPQPAPQSAPEYAEAAKIAAERLFQMLQEQVVRPNSTQASAAPTP